jgi:hypothetical protein
MRALHRTLGWKNFNLEILVTKNHADAHQKRT